jgi:hypothetical protein
MPRLLMLLVVGLMPAPAETPAYFGLPWGAVIVETRPLPSGVRANRALVLWMREPKRNDRGPLDEMNVYTCPEETLGSYYLGATRVSLVNTATRRVINTLPIRWDHGDGKDEFAIPYRIHGEAYYQVSGKSRDEEGKPELLHLRDFTGDGAALEFAFYEAEACMGLATAIYGYSVRQDRVVQYHAVLADPEDGTEEDAKWVDYLASEKQDAPGHWKYEIDYRGRGGCLDKYEVWYDPAHERFRGTHTSSPCAQWDK